MEQRLLGEELDELEPRDFRGAEAATAAITNTQRSHASKHQCRATVLIRYRMFVLRENLKYEL